MRAVVSYGTALGLANLHQALVDEAFERLRVASINEAHCPCKNCARTQSEAWDEYAKLTGYEAR